MGIFGQSTPFDAEVEKATSDKNTTENWALYMDVCDKVTLNPLNSKACLKAIMNRMAHADPHVVMQAITLLDACVNNCGKQFHLEIASREFENEYRRLLNAAQPKIAMKMRQVLKNWAENDFRTDPELNLIPSFYQKLRQDGHDFSNLSDKPPKSTTKLAALKDPNVVSSQREQDEIAKAIELSLQEAKSSPKKHQQQSSVAGGGSAGAAAYPSLYPSFTAGSSGIPAVGNNNPFSGAAAAESSSAPAPTEPRKVRALYDFEAAEDNELTFFAGEIIHVTDDSDPNWWKGYNQRSDGLFPSNFVTADLSVDPELLDINKQQKSKKSDQFDSDEAAAREHQEKTEATAAANNQPIEVDEAKVDRLLHLLHEANPEDPSQDTEEMRRLEREVHQMGPLIDAELERVDRKHAQLTQLSVDLVDAINLYHSLMRDDRAAALLGGTVSGFVGGMPSGVVPGSVGMPLGMGYQASPHMLYGAAGYPGAAAGAAGSFPAAQPQLGQSYAVATSFGSGAHMPPLSNTSAQLNSAQLPPATGSAGNVPGTASIYAPPQMQSQVIPMQYHNGGVNGATPQSVASSMPSNMYGTGGGLQQHNYQMLPPQQQHQFQQQQQGQTVLANTIPAIDQQQLQQQQQQQQQQIQISPAQQQHQQQQQQQFMSQSQNHAFIHSQQQQPQSQQHFLPMPSGPTSYMLPSTQTSNNNNNNPLHHQQQQHTQPNSTNISQLQQQMAEMSMAANNTAASSNQSVPQNFLVQNKSTNNIPIYQQQR